MGKKVFWCISVILTSFFSCILMHHASCLPLLEPCNITSTHIHTAHCRKEKKERKKKEKTAFSLYFATEWVICVAHSGRWKFFSLFLLFSTTDNASERAYERTKRREKKWRFLVGRLQARIEKNVIWSSSCRLWLIDDGCKRAEDAGERCAETMDMAFT